MVYLCVGSWNSASQMLKRLCQNKHKTQKFFFRACFSAITPFSLSSQHLAIDAIFRNYSDNNHSANLRLNCKEYYSFSRRIAWWCTKGFDFFKSPVFLFCFINVKQWGGEKFRFYPDEILVAQLLFAFTEQWVSSSFKTV